MHKLSPTCPVRIPRWPLLGHTYALAKNATQYLVRWSRRYGSIFSIEFLRKEYVVVAGMTAYNHLLKVGEAGLSRTRFFDRVTQEVGGMVVLTQPEHLHHDLRGKLRLAFSRQVAAQWLPQWVEALDASLAAHPVGSSVSVLDWSTRVCFEQFTLALCGENLKAVFDDANAFCHWTMTVGVKQWPDWVLALPVQKKRRARIMALMDRLLAEHAASLSQGAVSEAVRFRLLDALAQAKTDEGQALPKEDLVATLLYGFIGTLIYTNRAVAFLVCELINHPEAYARVEQEVDALYAGGRMPTGVDLRGLTLLRSALRESLRLHPISLGMPYNVDEDIEVGGCPIKAGQTCVFTFVTGHFSTDFYAQPEVFDLDRCMSPRNEHQQRSAHLPFGFGGRLCPAIGLVESLVLTTVSRLMYRRRLAAQVPHRPVRTVMAPLPGPERQWAMTFAAERVPAVVQEGALEGAQGLGESALTSLFEEQLQHEQRVRDMFARAQTQSFATGQAIVQEGDEADAFYVIVSGQVAVSRVGVPAPLAKLEAGQHFGETGLLNGAVRNATCRAVGEVSVLKIGRDDFLAIVRDLGLVHEEIAALSRHMDWMDKASKSLPHATPEQVQNLLRWGQMQTVLPNQVIVAQGDEATHFYIVLKGKVRVSQKTPSGEVKPLAVLEPGAFFGEIGILQGRARNASVHAHSESEVVLLVLERATLLAWVADKPEARSDLVSVVMQRVLGG